MPGSQIHGTVHTGAYNHMKGTQRGHGQRLGEAPGTGVSAYHVYKLDWTEDRVLFGIDDKFFYEFRNDNASNPATWPFDQPFHLLLNVAVGGMWGGMCLGGKYPDFPDDGVKNTMIVDYVRVYSELGGGTDAPTPAPGAPTPAPPPPPAPNAFDGDVWTSTSLTLVRPEEGGRKYGGSFFNRARASEPGGRMGGAHGCMGEWMSGCMGG